MSPDNRLSVTLEPGCRTRRHVHHHVYICVITHCEKHETVLYRSTLIAHFLPKSKDKRSRRRHPRRTPIGKCIGFAPNLRDTDQATPRKNLEKLCSKGLASLSWPQLDDTTSHRTSCVTVDIHRRKFCGVHGIITSLRISLPLNTLDCNQFAAVQLKIKSAQQPQSCGRSHGYLTRSNLGDRRACFLLFPKHI